MKVSDGTREETIRTEANKVMKRWREDLLEILAEHADKPGYDIHLAIYLTASYNFYLYLKKIVEDKGGVTWTEK